jgi:hypothetical protein
MMAIFRVLSQLKWTAVAKPACMVNHKPTECYSDYAHISFHRLFNCSVSTVEIIWH